MSDNDESLDELVDSQQDLVADQQNLGTSSMQIRQPRAGHGKSGKTSLELSQVGVRVAARAAGVSEDIIRALPDDNDDSESGDEGDTDSDESLESVSRNERSSVCKATSIPSDAAILVHATPERTNGSPESTKSSVRVHRSEYAGSSAARQELLPTADPSKSHSGCASPETIPSSVTSPTQSSTYDENRSHKLKIYKEGGLFALAEESAKDEVTGQVTFDGVTLEHLERIAYVIAVNTHPRILETCLTGSWAQKAKQDKELTRVLQKLRSRSKMKHPFIYVQELADQDGRSPTPNELFDAVEVAERYYRDEDRNMAKKIDDIRTPRRDAERLRDPSYRKYVYPRRKDLGVVTFPRSDSRIEIGLTFCKNLRARLAAIDPSKLDEPLAAPLVEIGYSAQIDERFGQHETHHSSNHIMNLFDAILSLRRGRRFRLHQFVIHSCVAGYEVAMAEVFFTALCEGYVYNGGGFTHYSPGISIGSSEKVSQDQWRQASEWSAEHMEVKKTHAKEMALQAKIHGDRLAANAQVETEIKDCEARIAAKKVEIEEHQRRFAADPNTADLLDMSADELEELEVDLEGQLHNKLAREVAELQALSEFMETLISQS